MVRIKLEKLGKYTNATDLDATIITTNKRGSISRSYISAEKQKEVDEDGYAYVNQPQERVV